jgi:hypothetical protein
VNIGVLRSVTLALAAAALLTSPAGAGANVSFDPFANELPEGLAFDRHGDMLVTLAPRGEVRKVDADGTQSTIATLSSPGEGFGLGVRGRPLP